VNQQDWCGVAPVIEMSETDEEAEKPCVCMEHLFLTTKKTKKEEGR
jgi:hypothetical protein